MKKYIALILLLGLAAGFAACGDEPQTNTATNTDAAPTVMSNPDDTPTQAYKRLFAAVKSKSFEAIKAEFSKNSIALAEAQAGKAKVPVEKVYENGFTETTFSQTLPEIRDERINGNMGAIEVWNAQSKRWEDLPFMREESGWKLAVGDAFAGNWKRPGLGRAAREREAANASGNRPAIHGAPNINIDAEMKKVMANLNRNANANTRK